MTCWPAAETLREGPASGFKDANESQLSPEQVCLPHFVAILTFISVGTLHCEGCHNCVQRLLSLCSLLCMRDLPCDLSWSTNNRSMSPAADVSCTCQVVEAAAVTGRIVDQLAPFDTEPALIESVDADMEDGGEQQDAQGGAAQLPDAPAVGEAQAAGGQAGSGNKKVVSITPAPSFCLP